MPNNDLLLSPSHITSPFSFFESQEYLKSSSSSILNSTNCFLRYAKFVLGEYLGSIKDLNSALEKDKTDISALSLRSRANFEINNYKGVISDIDSLVKLLDKKSEEEIIELSEKEINPIKTDIYCLTKSPPEALRREIGRDGWI